MTVKSMHHLSPPQKPRLLLHICCGPDATVPILDLREQYDIVAFWYDPNIHPAEEYYKRLDAFRKVAEREKIPFIEGLYESDLFFRLVKGLEHEPEKGARCTICYSFRMKRAIEEAQKNHCDAWTTTLNISPHKNFATLTTVGEALAKQYGIPYLAIPFFKKNGFARSVAYCKEHGIYRQKYCGCVYSETYPGRFDHQFTKTATTEPFHSATKPAKTPQDIVSAPLFPTDLLKIN